MVVVVEMERTDGFEKQVAAKLSRLGDGKIGACGGGWDQGSVSWDCLDSRWETVDERNSGSDPGFWDGGDGK